MTAVIRRDRFRRTHLARALKFGIRSMKPNSPFRGK
jgi:hypothetical protein